MINDDFFRALGIQIVKKSSTDWQGRCPSGNHEDKNPSWYICVDGPNEGKHFCHACGFSGNIFSLIMRVRNCNFYDAKKWASSYRSENVKIATHVKIVSPEVVPKFKLPDEVVIGVPFSEWPGSFRDYMLSRGVQPWQIDRWGHGYAMTGPLWGRVVLVVRDENNHPVSYMARTISSEQRRYMYPSKDTNANFNLFFGQNRWPHVLWRTDVVVTEGIFDAMAFERVAPDVSLLALGGSRVTPRLILRLSTFKRIFLALDADEAGEKCMQQIEFSMKSLASLIRRVKLPSGYDPSAMSTDDLREVFYG